jgi:hypothetical protein
MCNLRGFFDPKELELILSTFQASLLMLFNTGVPLILLVEQRGKRGSLAFVYPPTNLVVVWIPSILGG